jgi:hypothetical protein
MSKCEEHATLEIVLGQKYYHCEKKKVGTAVQTLPGPCVRLYFGTDTVWDQTKKDTDIYLVRCVKKVKLTTKKQAELDGLPMFFDKGNEEYKGNEFTIDDNTDMGALGYLCDLIQAQHFLGKARVVKSIGPESHDWKWDVCVTRVKDLAGLNHALKIYFGENGSRARASQIQIGSKFIAEYLEANYDVKMEIEDTRNASL